MNEKAAKPNNAANKDPSRTKSEELPRKSVERRRGATDPDLSKGNGDLALCLNFVKHMSDGNKTQKTIILMMAAVLVLIVVGLSIAVVVAKNAPSAWVGGAALVSVGSTAWFVRRKTCRSPTTEDQPGD
jgi:hypothetical protein